MAAAAPLGCDFVPSLRCAMDSAWGFISGCFLATSMVFVFAAWLVCELHAGLCPLRLRHGFSTSRRIVPTSVGTRFFLSDFLLDSNFGDFSCSTTSCLRWRQRQHFSDFTARLLPTPSTPEEAEVTSDFRNFVEQHQFYVPNLHFSRPTSGPDQGTSCEHLAGPSLLVEPLRGDLWTSGALLRQGGGPTSGPRTGAPQLEPLRGDELLLRGQRVLHALQERRRLLGVTSAGTTGEQTSVAGDFVV